MLIALAMTSVAHPQVSGGVPDPNNNNRDIAIRNAIQAQNSKDAREAAQKQAQIEKFMAAIKPRKDMYPDFDKVVIQSNTPMTQGMLGMIAQSPYAADIAYYLGQHPEQSAGIAKAPAQQAQAAIKQIEAAAAATNPIRK
jgi:hypothetical protein